MSTKKECENALMNLCSSNAKVKDRHIFKDLIEEHFDNPPLKFEEIKENMWVWDNENNSWLKVIGFYGFNIHVQFGIGIHKNDCYVEYVENRFYRKQVGE